MRAGDRFLFYQGNYLVSIAGAAGAAHLPLLARHLERQAGAQASLPTLPSYLPADGLLAASDRYLLGPVALGQVVPLAPGDWLGFAYGAEAEAARYRVEGEDGTFLLINYPTPQIAAERLRDFEHLFNLNGTGDPSRPLVYAKRAGTLVAFVAGIKSGQAAARILNQVRYEAELSWSRLSEPRAQASWVLTLMNIFIATGILMLFVLLSGITFGLVRLAIQRLLPGKVFDRPGDSEIIRLDLDNRR